MKREVLQIKKYPNRRYYDATRSCHVTLHEVYDLVRSGSDVVITDSRTGEDITNLVLLQVVLEKDQPKLDLFPTSMLHLMIRANRQMVREFVDRSFGPFMSMMASSQRQIDAYWRQAMSGKLASPLDWADSMMSAISGNHNQNGESVPEEGIVDWGDERPPQSPETKIEAVAELRNQVANLSRQIEALTAKLGDRPSTAGAGQ